MESRRGDRYVLYGDLRDRRTAVLAGVLVAKGLAVGFVQQTPSLALNLATRAGRSDGPFLRTPEGFVLAGNRPMLRFVRALGFRAEPVEEDRSLVRILKDL